MNMAVETAIPGFPPRPIEATSLSSLLHLASNPPHAPSRPPTNTSPLVLYIARVPGSRDVFLTPIKPRDRVVTASDVQSSLYYLHCNREPERSAKAEFEVEPMDCSGGTQHRRDDVVAPAGAGAPQLFSGSAPQLPFRKAALIGMTTRPLSPPHFTPSIAYVDENEKPKLPPRAINMRQNTIKRKPLLPARPPERPTELDLPVLPPRPLPPTPPQEDDCISSPLSGADRTRPQEQTPNHSQGTLTLIRRNPTTNEQWNVATIHDPPMEEISSLSLRLPTADRRTKRAGVPLYVTVLNAGYDIFDATDEAAERTSEGSLESLREPSLSTQSSANSGSALRAASTFQRRIYLPGSKYAEHEYSNLGHTQHQPIDSASSMSGESLSLRQSLAIPSAQLRSNHRNSWSSLQRTTNPSPLLRMKRTKGYTFLSPWNGTCEFTTGGPTGTNLKCRHHLLRPGVSEENSNEDVSELRFNLPSTNKTVSTPRPQSTTSLPIFPRDSQLSSANLGHNRYPSSPVPELLFAFDDDGNIDLTLGREKAGGGFGGRQAKLGKLIVWPAGLAMLDLLVAANLGLWWRGWDKVAGPE